MYRAILTILLAATCVMPASSQSKRALQPSDLVRLERFGEAAFSPDGKWLAYTVVRSRDTAANQMRAYMLGADRADIWIVPVAGGQPTNITRGASDKSGYWSPAWSPDAERLAFLSTKAGLTRLWLWSALREGYDR